MSARKKLRSRYRGRLAVGAALATVSTQLAGCSSEGVASSLPFIGDDSFGTRSLGDDQRIAARVTPVTAQDGLVTADLFVEVQKREGDQWVKDDFAREYFVANIDLIVGGYIETGSYETVESGNRVINRVEADCPFYLEEKGDEVYGSADVWANGDEFELKTDAVSIKDVCDQAKATAPANRELGRSLLE